MDKNKEKGISLSDFQSPVEEGLNQFTILDAYYNTISTKNGDKEIVQLKVELKDQSDSSLKMTLEKYYLFIDYTKGGSFNHFIKSVLKVLNSTTFRPESLIGLEGVVELSYYKPTGKSISYEQLNNWTFKISQEQTNQKLNKYLEENQNNFELGDEDLDF